ncbi:MAG TPA: hypothetical protein IAA29_15065 [Candidatus Paenibacillus intestinavium]|nr:hypothetical protein [Candidatus Paenibacillus intestinavium]
MARLRLIVLILCFELIITAVVGIGIYAGFSVYPFTQGVEANPTTTFGSITQTTTTTQFSATLPLYMPQLSTLKIPYTLLQPMKQEWGIITIFVSAALLVLQSFVRGMYLGGIKELVLRHKPVSLLECGRKYFRDMLAFSVIQVCAGWLLIGLAVIFFQLDLF